MNRVYLKAYTGIFYSDNRFTDIVPDGSGTFEYAKADRYIPVGAEYADTGENAFMKMFVLNVDADNTFDYRPYFSLYSSTSRNEKAMGISNDLSQMIAKDTQISKILGEDTKKISEWAEENTGEDEQGSFYELIYTPYSPGQKYEKNDTITKEYEAFVYENYLGIPEDLKSSAGLRRMSAYLKIP